VEAVLEEVKMKGLEVEEAACLEEVLVVVELMQEVEDLETVSVVHMEEAVV
jgi:hypothetical protein